MTNRAVIDTEITAIYRYSKGLLRLKIASEFGYGALVGLKIFSVPAAVGSRSTIFVLFRLFAY